MAMGFICISVNFSLINNCISDEEIRGEMNARSHLYVFVSSSCMSLCNVKRLLNMCKKKHNEYTDFHLFLILEKEIGQ